MLGKLSEKEAEELLQQHLICRLGCIANDQLYVVPVNYVYHEGSVLAHTVPGHKIDLMRKNPKVCVEVDEIKGFNEWKSVIAWGTYEEIVNEEEKMAAMKVFVDRTLRVKISETAVLPELHGKRVHPRSPGNIELIVYRINIHTKTGRFETPGEE